MYKASILYHRPADERAFDDYYWNVHVPIASRMKGIKRWTITKLEGAHPGADVPYYLLVELYADNRDDLFAILESAEGLQSADDVRTFADGAVTHMYGEEQIIGSESRNESGLTT